MEEIFMIKQLMTRLSKMMKSEKCQQDKVMPIQPVIYQILLILKKQTNLGKQKVLDADTKAIQQIIFTGKANNQIRFITFLNNQKKESQNLQKEQQKFCNYI